ncbi:hypothetical protein Tco_1268049 [Tanacetum coccineum]
MNSPPNYELEQLLDIDDSNLPLTPFLCTCNIHVRETTTTTQTPDVDNLEEKSVRIISGLAVTVQATKLHKQSDIHEGGDESVLSTQEYIRKVVKDVGNNQVLRSECTWRSHRGVLILANVSVFSPKQSLHYLKITIRNVVKVFHKDTVLGNGSGVGWSRMLDEEEIMKLLEEEEMDELELQDGRNVTDEEHQLRLDEDALILALEEEEREVRAEQEWLDKCRQ